jgi:hypothetical protein
VAHVQYGDQPHPAPAPAGREGPAGEQHVVAGVQRRGHVVARGHRARRADGPQFARERVINVGDGSLFGRTRFEQPSRHDQHQRPQPADHELDGLWPPRPQRAERPESERCVDQQLEPGHGSDVTERGHRRGHPGHQNERQHGDPAVAVDHLADHQPRRPAEQHRRPHPAHAKQVRAAQVDHDPDQAAHGRQQAQCPVTRRHPDGERHADRERGPQHGRPGRRRWLGPHHLGQPIGHDCLALDHKHLFT